MTSALAPSISTASTRLEDPKMVATISFVALMIFGVAVSLVGVFAGFTITTILGGLLTAASGFALGWSTIYFGLKDK